jgi:tRNA 2-thiouridine synthesizing protein A
MISQSTDTRGLSRPLPMMKARSVMEALLTGQILEIFSSDPGSFRDMDALCRSTATPWFHPKIKLMEAIVS